MRQRKQNLYHVRNSVIKRDNYRCRACGLPDVDNLQCDHIVPESLGGSGELENLQALCAICNNRKGQANLPELPVRPPVDPTMTWAELSAEIKANRKAFARTIKASKTEQQSAEIEELTRRAVEWHNDGVRMVTIVNRLERMTTKTNANRIRLYIMESK